MAFEMAREAGACFSFVDFMSCITITKRPCYGPLKFSRAILLFVNILLVSSYINGGPPTAMNAILAIIADGGQAIVVIYREAVELN